MHLDDVGMIERFCEFEFVLEEGDFLLVLAEIGSQDFQRVAIPRAGLNGFPHLAGRTHTDQASEPVGP